MRTSTRFALLTVFALTTNLSTKANDIVDFLRAVNGYPDRPPVVQPVSRHQHGGSGFSGGPGRVMPSHDARRYETAGRPNQFEMNRGGFNGPNSFGGERVSFRDHGYSGRAYPSRTQARITFNVGNGGYAPPTYVPVQQVPVQPLPPVDSYPVVPSVPVPGQGYSYPMSFEIGQIVDCRVPLATCVRVEDECNIAPHAVPVVVAVRDPNACEHNPNALVFVQVFTPPCPPRSVRVSPCQTRVTMCFGQYEVDIKSKNGMVVVDYDN